MEQLSGSSTIATAVGSAQITDSLITLHGVSHNEEVEATSNTQQILQINENISKTLNDQKIRRIKLHQLKDEIINHGIKATADATRKMSQLSSSFELYSKSNENIYESLNQLSVDALKCTDEVGAVNDAAANEFQMLERLLTDLQRVKKSALYEQERHQQLQVDLKAATQLLEETKSMLIVTRKSASSTSEEMQNLLKVIEKDKESLKRHQKILSEVITNHGAMEQRYHDTLNTITKKEETINAEVKQIEQSKISLTNDYIDKNQQLKIFDKTLKEKNVSIAHLLRIIDDHETKLQCVQQKQVENQTKLNVAKKETERLRYLLKDKFNIEVKMSNEKQLELPASPSDNNGTVSPRSVVSRDSLSNTSSLVSPVSEEYKFNGSSPSLLRGLQEPSPFKSLNTSSMTVVQLRQELKSRNGDTKGLKSVLLKRLNSILENEEANYLMRLKGYNNEKADSVSSPSLPTLILALKEDILDGEYINNLKNSILKCKEEYSNMESTLNELNHLIDIESDTSAGSSCLEFQSLSPTALLEKDIESTHAELLENQKQIKQLENFHQKQKDIDSMQLLLGSLLETDGAFFEEAKKMIENIESENNNIKQWSVKLDQLIEIKKNRIQEEMLHLKNHCKQKESDFESKFENAKKERNSLRTSLDLVESYIAEEHMRLKGCR